MFGRSAVGEPRLASLVLGCVVCPHQDHIGGRTAVLQNFHVSRLWLGRETTAPAFLRLKQTATALHVPIEQQRRGQSFVWDGVQVDFLWPEGVAEGVEPIAKNNDSVVVRLRYRERTILLPGDAEKQVESTMPAENDSAFLHADVLKVGHHGSKNSSVPEFCRRCIREFPRSLRGRRIRTDTPARNCCNGSQMWELTLYEQTTTVRCRF